VSTGGKRAGAAGANRLDACGKEPFFLSKLKGIRQHFDFLQKALETFQFRELFSSERYEMIVHIVLVDEVSLGPRI
jgi:hypothetical protein